jgi:hypothetical protein
VRQLFASEIAEIRRLIDKQSYANFNILSRIERIPSPLEFGEAILGKKFDGWQRRYMEECRARGRIAMAACRQSGKSTVTGLFVAWCLIFIPGFQCLVASRSLRQASHYLNAVRQAVLSVIPKEAMVQVNRLSLELPNGSAIISIPCAQPDAGRGFSPHLIILDEAAFAPEALFVAISPSLGATDGALHMLSSPNGRQGYFFEAFEGTAKSEFLSIRVPYTLCPRISEETIKSERVLLGDLYFRQEYGAEFITPYGAFFGFSAIKNLEDGEDPDLSDLELLDMDKVLEKIMPIPQPTREDLTVALDRAQRVRSIMYDD